MSARTTRKVIYYLRCTQNNKPLNLESLITRARKAKPTVAASEIKLSQGDIVRIQHFRTNKNVGVFVHLARYVPGEQASTLLPKAKAVEDDEGTQAAPVGKEFKDGDSFILVSRHHVLYCGHGISISRTDNYISALLKEAGIAKNARQYELSPASSLNKLKLMQEHGVKSILLSSNAFDVSLPKKQRGKWISRTLGSIADEFIALLEKDDAASEQKVMEDLLVNVEIRLDGNTRATVDAQSFIEKVAETVLEDEDAPISEFSIMTQSNERISSSDIRLQTAITVPQKNRSISHLSVWEELENYLGTLKHGNLLEQ